MENQAYEFNRPGDVHFGHLGAVFMAAVLLLGISWVKNPEIFSFHREAKYVSDSSIPRYYAYNPPVNNTPMVAGASTIEGPSIINEDGSISPALDAGGVLGATTEEMKVSMDDIAVTTVPDSDEAARNYIRASGKIESGFIDNREFDLALNSQDQEQIDAQAKKISAIISELQKLALPAGFVKLHKLKIIQYHAAEGMLKHFTMLDENPELVGRDLGLFLKAQQDLEAEQQALLGKYNLYEPSGL